MAKRKAAPKKAPKTAKTALLPDWEYAAGHQQTKNAAYDATAQRVIAAVKELNAALTEAFERPDMRVFLKRTGDDLPAQFEYEIYQLTHAVMRWTVKVADDGSVKAALQSAQQS